MTQLIVVAVNGIYFLLHLPDCSAPSHFNHGLRCFWSLTECVDFYWFTESNPGTSQKNVKRRFRMRIQKMFLHEARCHV